MKTEILENQKCYLLENLKDFGLDPNQWRLKKVSSDKFLIQSKTEDDFLFFGETTQNQSSQDWKQIQLMGL